MRASPSPASPPEADLPLRRGHLADGVFAVLGAEILRGVMAPGSPLPSERVLSERFGVSKLLVRQAVHRLAEAGLVDVRQGGATRVRDPDDAADLRVIELYYRLAPESPQARALARDVLEKQFTQGLSLVEVFARRASAAARDALVALTEGARADRDDDAKMRALEERFWRDVGDACENRILRAEVRWWYTALAARPDRPEPPPPSARWAFYAELARRLRDGDAPISFYLAALTPGIDALFASTSPSTRGAKARSKQVSR
ncbi:MAG: FadR family transcriptional regulator [Labilithrix sp.]|nr:FadR family transcriptional regulator [Labilithrix sp.]